MGAHLERANLSGAHLEQAYLSDANLEGADLIGAHLERADLSDANLEGADLIGATGLARRARARRRLTRGREDCVRKPVISVRNSATVPAVGPAPTSR